MERSEPSLVPEWLRSNGCGTSGGGSVQHFASSQADSPVSALPRSTSSKNIGNTDSLHSPLLDRSISYNSRRSSNSNGFSKHDKNSYTRPYSSYSRSHRDWDRERSTVSDTRVLEYSDPLRGMVGGRSEDPLRLSQSSTSRRIGEAPQRRIPEDIRNGINKNHGNGNGTHSSGGNVTGVPKVSFERDFPVLGSEERPRTPDIARGSSPGLSRAIQSLSMVNPQSVGSEAWTSALVEVPSSLGSNSCQLVQPATTATSLSSNSSSMPTPANTSSGLKMAEALVQAPAQTLNATQQPSVQSQKDEFAVAQSRKLIPMTPLSKTLVRSSSDTLKPRTPSRPSETTGTPKNGVHHLSPLQLGSQSARGVIVKGDGPKSPSGKLLLLKAGRENGVSHGLKDLQSPTGIINSRVANGHPTANQSVVLGPTKNPLSPKILPGDRKASGAGVDKRTSRSNFFKLMREKSLNNTSGTTVDSGASISSEVVEKPDIEAKELVGDQGTADHTGNELKCNGETCTVGDSLSPSMEIDYEKERALLFSLGWEDHGEDDEEGLTEEEIYAFYIEVMKQDPNSRLSLILQEKIFSHVGCFSSTEANSPASPAEA